MPSTGLPRNYLCLSEIGEKEYLIGTESGEVCSFSKGVFKWGDISGKGKVSSIIVNQNKDVFVGIGNELVKFSISGNKLIEKGRK